MATFSELAIELRGDGWRLFGTRGLRMFAYGFLSVTLALYLKAQGLSEGQIGVLLTLTLAGDVALSLLITNLADRLGRRRMLIVGSLLMSLVGLVFAVTSNFVWLAVVATIGVLSPSDKEVGPFLSIEQSVLAGLVRDRDRVLVFAWYNLIGALMAAFGALFGGFTSQTLAQWGAGDIDFHVEDSYRPLVVAYGLVGLALAIGFSRLSRNIEARKEVTKESAKGWLGLRRSRGIVTRLSLLFAMDAFGGGFILQSMLALWFHLRYDLDPASLGTIFFVANLLAAVSALSAARLAARVGLIRTMVFTHLPSNVLLILIPIAPNLPCAIGLLLTRFAISQMDIPTRQAYTMAVVHPEERSAAAGVTTVARSVGAAISPTLAGYCYEHDGLRNVPLFIAGGVKIIYDLWLYRAFVARPLASEPESS